MHQCIDHSDLISGYSVLNKTSSLELSQRDPTKQELSNKDKFLYYYDDPALTTDNIADIFEPSKTNYTVLKYATVI